MKTFYISTPIYYVNDNPHLGHAYCTIAADCLARFHRLMGERVFFLTGTDEHGQKVERSAAKAGITPKDLADRVVVNYFNLWKRLNISNDDFIRTTDERHVQGALKLFNIIKEKGDIYKAKYKGPYCVSCETFFPESQLIEGRCPDFGHAVEILEEESYFFKLSKYQEPLLRYYKEHPDFVMPPSRMNEVQSFVEAGLKDLSISRTTIKWGIPIPGDDKHVIYVWLDALSNYITALGFGSDKGDDLKPFWPCDVHIIGKDILRFHSVYWPAFLMSADLPLPKHIFGHGWWLKDEKKISKSLGNLVDVKPFLDSFGADSLRYFVLREIPFGSDGSFSDETFIDRLNADLANDIGNLVSRLSKMLSGFTNGKIPDGKMDLSLAASSKKAIDKYIENMKDFRIKEAIEETWSLISETNKYLVSKSPWKLIRDTSKKDELKDCLYNASLALRASAMMLLPVMPESAKEILETFGFSPSNLSDYSYESNSRECTSLKGPLFPRIDKKIYFAGVKADDIAESPKATENLISIEDFIKAGLKVAKILEAERVPKSDKLIKLTIDLGVEKSQIVAGIGKKYAPEMLTGRTIVVVTNLKPAKLMGIESRGMLLAASIDGEPELCSFESPPPPGTPVK